MKKVMHYLLAPFFLSVGISAAYAETQYVTENLSTFLRKGAGEQFKIAGSIQAGEAVTVLDKKDRYTLIRDSKNRECQQQAGKPKTQKPDSRIKLKTQSIR